VAEEFVGAVNEVDLHKDCGARWHLAADW